MSSNRNKITVISNSVKPQRYNQPSLEYGKFHRTNDLFLQQLNGKEENKGNGNCYRLKEM